MVSTNKIQQIILDLQAAERELSKNASSTLAHHLTNKNHEPTRTNHNEELTILQLKIDHISVELEAKSKLALSLTSEVEKLKTDNHKLAQDLYSAQKENIINKRHKDQTTLENESLVNNLLKVQFELEQYYEDKIALETALEQSNSALERARVIIRSLDKKEF